MVTEKELRDSKLVTKNELRDSNWYSLKDYHGETTDALAKDVDSLAVGISKTVLKLKKMQRWHGVWNIWSLMQRRSDSKSGKSRLQNSQSMAKNVL